MYKTALYFYSLLINERYQMPEDQGEVNIANHQYTSEILHFAPMVDRNCHSAKAIIEQQPNRPSPSKPQMIGIQKSQIRMIYHKQLVPLK